MEIVNIGIIRDVKSDFASITDSISARSNFNLKFDICTRNVLFENLKQFKIELLICDSEILKNTGNDILYFLRTHYAEVLIIVKVKFLEIKLMSALLITGVKAIIPEYYKVERIVNLIDQVQRNGYYIDLEYIEGLKNDTYTKDYSLNKNGIELSMLEKKILKHICTEKSNEEISNLLSVSKRTIEWHKNNMIKKTKSKNIVGLVKFAVLMNII